MMLNYLKNWMNKTKKVHKSQQYNVQWWQYAIIIFGCWIPVYISFFPGILSYDGPYEIYCKVDPIQPFFHVFILKSFYNIGVLFNSATIGIALYSLVQMIIMSSIFGYCTKFIEERICHKKLTIFVMIFFALFQKKSVDKSKTVWYSN